jgi:hypothetical protein
VTTTERTTDVHDQELAQLRHAWGTVAQILGAGPSDTADHVFAIARRLVADRSPDQLQLSWDTVPREISRTELERRILLAMHSMHFMVCGHASTASMILRDGVEPPTSTRCAPWTTGPRRALHVTA